jgi:hypothetical protein
MPQTFNVGAQSRFVTGIAWIFIVLAVSMGASAVVQHLVLADGTAGLRSFGTRSPWPGLTGLLVGYLPWLQGAGLLVAMATLASAIGLLLRLNWARRTFIAMLAVAIGANLLGLWLQQEVVQSVVSQTLSAVALPPPAMSVFGGFVTAARVMAVLMTLAGCSVLGWIIRRLMSATVRQEFG